MNKQVLAIKIEPISISPHQFNKAFRRVETLFVQGNQVRTESKQTSFFSNKKGGLF